MYGSYGSTFAPKQQSQLLPTRRRLNLVPILISWFYPWVLFCLTSAVLSFSPHYNYPHAAYAAVAFGLVVVMMNGVVALEATRTKEDEYRPAEPGWYIFAFFTALLAWSLGVALGNMNFFYNMQPFYDVVGLNSYDGVDPSRTKGQELMDAGRIVFTGTSKLDLRKAMGFKNLDMYCVAPVTVSQGNVSLAPLAVYDYWAVGINCCSGGAADFACGDSGSSNAHGGLRVLRDDQRPFFRLAVQEAEAQYGIKAIHPIFLYWSADPTAQAKNYQADGFKYYILGMMAHFSLQLFLLVCAVVVFSKMGKY